MEEENIRIRFNHILREEMGNMFGWKPLPLDSEFKAKIAKNDKNISSLDITRCLLLEPLHQVVELEEFISNPTQLLRMDLINWFSTS